MDDEKLREEFPGNSYSGIEPRNTEVPDLSQAKISEEAIKKPEAKEEHKKKPVVKPKKLTIGERIVSAVRSIDPAEMFEKIVYDWVFPGFQAAGEEILRIIFGSGRGSAGTRTTSTRDKGRNRTYYSSIYDGPPRRNSVGTSTKPQIIFEKRSEAEQVLSAAAEYIDDYGQVTLKDFYTLIDEITEGNISIVADYPTRGYGWRSIESADISRVRDGYLLTMPKVEVLR